MLKLIASIALAATIVSPPLPGFAQTAQPGASTPHRAHVHTPTGSYRSEMRRRSNLSRERARESAEHMRRMRQQ